MDVCPRLNIALAKVGSNEHYTELDLHADMCLLGHNTKITHKHDSKVSVTGYDKTLGKKQYNIVSGKVAYNDPTIDQAIVIKIHQAIYIPAMSHNLLSPMQLMLNGTKIDTKPKFLHVAPTESSHAIVAPFIDAGNGSDPCTIHLSLSGIVSYFPSRYPSNEECIEAPQIKLMSEQPEWDPHNASFALQEQSHFDSAGQYRKPGDRETGDSRTGWRLLYKIQLSSHNGDNSPIVLLQSMENNSVNISSMQTSGRKRTIDAETLAKNWGIGLQAAKQTIKVTTQRGIRTVANPSQSRRFRTKNRQQRYRRLRADVFTNTLVAGVASRRMSKYAQVFCTSFGWTRCFPMKAKSNAHKTLSTLFSRDGVPNILVMNGATEQVADMLQKKAHQANCCIRQTEPLTPWSNAAKGAIRELKQGAMRKMIATGSPRRLWDH